jgi:hypothetical protein
MKIVSHETYISHGPAAFRDSGAVRPMCFSTFPAIEKHDCRAMAQVTAKRPRLQITA